MADWRSIADIRREYGDLSIDEATVEKNPIAQFRQWFSDIIKVEKQDPTAMVLSTVDEQGLPDARVVLLKGIEQEAFVFYTNYNSAKSLQIHHQPYVALTFYWPQMARQVRIRGRVTRISEQQSDAYFASRPKESQLGAIASPQSQEVLSRRQLEDAFNKLVEAESQGPIVRPSHWGGYAVSPDNIEFWQGRDSRLHDRIRYIKKAGAWLIQRLAP